ncbi:MAG TPA: hypothetical protein VHY31_23150 [Streptosporangiaceae bacterium]|jgi:hypothetical protein|nr:hypothetical protein [Streptosporangiaceae bacterium]
MPGPWDGPVRVVHTGAASFRFATLAGHLEAGEIEFRRAAALAGGRPRGGVTIRTRWVDWPPPGRDDRPAETAAEV